MSEQSPVKSRGNALLLIVMAGVIAAVAAGVYALVAGGFDFRPRLKLAIVTNSEDPFWNPVVQGAQDAARDAKVDLTVVYSKPDAEAQSQSVRNLLAKGIEGIAISPVNPVAEAAVLDEAAGKGPLITFDSDAPNSKRRVFVGTDNYAAGQLAGNEVRLAVPDGGPVVIAVGSIDQVNGNRRRQGLIDNLTGQSFNRNRDTYPLDAELKGPEYSIAATVVDGGDSAKAQSRLADALKAHPDVKCVVGLFAWNAPAAVKAIEQSGKTGQVKVVGFDEAEETQAGIEAGTVFSSILQNQYRMGSEAVRALAGAARGIEDQGPKGPELTYLALFVLRTDNLAEFRARGRIRQPGAKAR